MSKFERMIRNPEICGGQLIFKGTRVMVSIVFECVKEGLSFNEILESYPSISQEDIDEAFKYVINILQKTNR
ncbi:MAG: DUF433 domain-containing protein [Candidatus Heimdallarchaeota archaeon]